MQLHAGDEMAASVKLAMEYDPKPLFGTVEQHNAPADRQKIVMEVLRNKPTGPVASLG